MKKKPHRRRGHTNGFYFSPYAFGTAYRPNPSLPPTLPTSRQIRYTLLQLQLAGTRTRFNVFPPRFVSPHAHGVLSPPPALQIIWLINATETHLEAYFSNGLHPSSGAGPEYMRTATVKNLPRFISLIYHYFFFQTFFPAGRLQT